MLVIWLQVCKIFGLLVITQLYQLISVKVLKPNFLIQVWHAIGVIKLAQFLADHVFLVTLPFLVLFKFLQIRISGSNKEFFDRNTLLVWGTLIALSLNFSNTHAFVLKEIKEAVLLEFFIIVSHQTLVLNSPCFSFWFIIDPGFRKVAHKGQESFFCDSQSH